jgi:hypothetical protein
LSGTQRHGASRAKRHALRVRSKEGLGGIERRFVVEHFQEVEQKRAVEVVLSERLR